MSSRKADLRLDWATHEAARYAVERWHYSRSIPVSKLVKIGAWEDGKFIGVVVFSRGANKSLGKPYGLAMTEYCELVRIALTTHTSSVSRIVAIAVQMLTKKFPGLRLVISFADPAAGHHGGIYQAGNWIYSGLCPATFEFRLNGQRLNKRAYTGVMFGDRRLPVPVGAERVKVDGKHRYLLPLDAAMRAQITPLAKPYPKRAKQAMAGPPAQRQGSTDPHAPAFGTSGPEVEQR